MRCGCGVPSFMARARGSTMGHRALAGQPRGPLRPSRGHPRGDSARERVRGLGPRHGPGRELRVRHGQAGPGPRRAAACRRPASRSRYSARRMVRLATRIYFPDEAHANLVDAARASRGHVNGSWRCRMAGYGSRFTCRAITIFRSLPFSSLFHLDPPRRRPPTARGYRRCRSRARWARGGQGRVIPDEAAAAISAACSGRGNRHRLARPRGAGGRQSRRAARIRSPRRCPRSTRGVHWGGTARTWSTPRRCNRFHHVESRLCRWLL